MMHFACILPIILLILAGCSSEIDTCKLRRENVCKDITLLKELEVKPTHPLTYSDVMHFAMTRNIEVLAREHESAIQRENISAEKLSMLPTLTARANDETRSPILAQSSRSLATGGVSVVPSVSTERPSRTWNAQLVWGLVDFGLSYYRARIEEKRLIILQEQHERLKQNLLLDVAKGYWKAIISGEALAGSQRLMHRITERQKKLQMEIKERLLNANDGYDAEKRLDEMKLRLYVFEYDHMYAKTQLSSLIGLRVGNCYELASPLLYKECVPCIEQLEKDALLNRPELKGGDVDEKLQMDTIRSTLVSMFPNAQLFGGYNYDHNPFLVFNDWWNVGIRAVWELLTLPKQVKQYGAAVAKKENSLFTRIALAVGVISQVHLAYIEYIQVNKQLEVAKALADDNARALYAARKSFAAGDYHIDDLLRIETDAFLSRINALHSYADSQVAIEKINNAVGLPLAFSKPTDSYLSSFLGKEEISP